jgi:uncharacterized low-complexity protein
MLAFLEELAVCITISLGVRVVTTVAGALFTPAKNVVPDQQQTCGVCGQTKAAEGHLSHEHEATP